MMMNNQDLTIWSQYLGKTVEQNQLSSIFHSSLFDSFSDTTRFRIDKVKPWNGLWKRMDFRLEWIEILNFTISLLTGKMILIFSIGMN